MDIAGLASERSSRLGWCPMKTRMVSYEEMNEARNIINDLKRSLQRLVDRDPDQEISEYAYRPIDAALRLAAGQVGDHPVVREIRESPETSPPSGSVWLTIRWVLAANQRWVLAANQRIADSPLTLCAPRTASLRMQVATVVTASQIWWWCDRLTAEGRVLSLWPGPLSDSSYKRDPGKPRSRLLKEHS